MRALTEISVCAKLPLVLHPLVASELTEWESRASKIPDKTLREQALSSLRRKRFHCVGGSLLGLLAPERVREIVKAIVAIQTISDYLDNLCDRAHVRPDYDAFMLLHEALMCSVDPRREVRDFYALYPLGRRRSRPDAPDGGYLHALVEVSRSVVKELPQYGVVRERVLRLCGLYSEMQSAKHLDPACRVVRMVDWFEEKKRGALWSGRSAELSWPEFAAAAGSTLGTFCLISSASKPSLAEEEAELLDEAYFPAICGLHILLDYLVDLREDREGGDLNFVAHYSSLEQAVARLQNFVLLAKEAASRLDALPGVVPARIHSSLVKGLLAMYLSDSKVAEQGLAEAAKKMIGTAGAPVGFLKGACGLARRTLRF